MVAAERARECQDPRVPDDAYFPYASAFVPGPGPSCKVGPNRDARAVKITRWSTVASVVDRKNYLTNTGRARR